MAVVLTRNLRLSPVEKAKDLTSDFKSAIIDFKEMNTGTIQSIVNGQDENDGIFSLEVSLLCEPSTFLPYPDSERGMSAACSNFGWQFCCLAWRYARVCYTNGTLATGTVDIWARGKRT